MIKALQQYKDTLIKMSKAFLKKGEEIDVCSEEDAVSIFGKPDPEENAAPNYLKDIITVKEDEKCRIRACMSLLYDIEGEERLYFDPEGNPYTVVLRRCFKCKELIPIPSGVLDAIGRIDKKIGFICEKCNSDG